MIATYIIFLFPTSNYLYYASITKDFPILKKLNASKNLWYYYPIKVIHVLL